jgi:hypothetical protein
MGDEKRGRGHPKSFENEDELIRLWTEYNVEIRANGYIDVPTRSAFCERLTENHKSVDRKTIYTSITKYFPNIKKDFLDILSDTLATGAMLGKYNSTMTIFALKNWSDWKDKQEIEQDINAKGLEVTINVID